MKSTTILFIVCFLTISYGIFAQENKCEPKVTADLVSTYIWRGVKSSGTPNFQPTIGFTKGGLEVGIWGSTDFIGAYKEVDPYISYTIKDKFKIMVTDYNWNFTHSYFDFENKTTDHVVEASIGFLGTDNFPLSVQVNTFIYGADKQATNATKQNYSTYVEFNYAFKKWTLIAAITPMDGYYGDGYGKYEGFSVCNIGATATRNVKLGDWEIPLKSTLIINPQAEDVFLVFGITF